MDDVEGLHPLSRWRYATHPGHYLMVEVANDLEVSANAIRRRCAERPGLMPALIGSYAGRDVWLFTPDEAEALRAEFGAHPARVGRPQVWTAAEQADRQRRRVRLQYWANAAELARAQGRNAKAKSAERNAATLAQGLRVQRPRSLAR